MNQIKIRYISDFQYDNVISEALFEFRIKPEENEYQQIINEQFESNLGLKPYEFKDFFQGNCLQLRPQQSFKSLQVTYEALVEVVEKPLVFASKIMADEEHKLLKSPKFYVDYQVFIRPTALTKLETKLEKTPSFDASKSIYQFASELNSWVHRFITYTKNVTTTTTTAQEVASLRKGVCQDYSHLFLAICRKNKIPCRYVSGYIKQQRKLQGDDFMHAWAEVLIPEIGWVGFDPTNDLLVDYHFVKVCHGIDYTDCKPIKGVLFSSFNYQLQEETIEQ
jgi:transglutaminase-like putative cysteine protease